MADDARYNIVFRGELVAGADPGQVRENLGKLFKMEAERVEKLFAGKPVVVKKNADQATAMKMRAMLKKAGAECEMQRVGGDDAGAAPASSASTAASFAASETSGSAAPEPASKPAPEDTPADAAPASADSGSGATGGDSDTPTGATGEAEPPPEDVEMVGTIRTGGTSFSGEFDVAPAGAELEQAESNEEPVDPDISHLSLAPPGTDLEQLQSDEKVEVPDISHLKVVDDTAGEPSG